MRRLDILFPLLVNNYGSKQNKKIKQNYPQVERCRCQLFGHENISGDPPEPLPSWRDDCSLILHKEVNLRACTVAKVFYQNSML